MYFNFPGVTEGTWRVWDRAAVRSGGRTGRVWRRGGSTCSSALPAPAATSQTDSPPALCAARNQRKLQVATSTHLYSYL